MQRFVSKYADECYLPGDVLSTKDMVANKMQSVFSATNNVTHVKNELVRS